MSDRLYVNNWGKYQHYKKRNPPWIKLQTNTFASYDFSRLQFASKTLALCIWTLASCSLDGSVPNDLKWIADEGHLGECVTQENLQELISKGFMSETPIASTTLAERTQDASAPESKPLLRDRDRDRDRAEAEETPPKTSPTTPGKNANNVSRFNSQEVAVAICRELRIAKDSDIKEIEAVVENEHLATERDRQEIGDSMIAAWKEFEAIPASERRFDWPAAAFFTKDQWRRPDSWRKSAEKTKPRELTATERLALLKRRARGE